MEVVHEESDKRGNVAGSGGPDIPRANSSTLRLLQMPTQNVEASSPGQGLYGLLLPPGVMLRAVYTHQVIGPHLVETVSYLVQSLRYTVTEPEPSLMKGFKQIVQLINDRARTRTQNFDNQLQNLPHSQARHIAYTPDYTWTLSVLFVSTH